MKKSTVKISMEMRVSTPEISIMNDRTSLSLNCFLFYILKLFKETVIDFSSKNLANNYWRSSKIPKEKPLRARLAVSQTMERNSILRSDN